MINMVYAKINTLKFKNVYYIYLSIYDFYHFVIECKVYIYIYSKLYDIYYSIIWCTSFINVIFL